VRSSGKFEGQGRRTNERTERTWVAISCQARSRLNPSVPVKQKCSRAYTDLCGHADGPAAGGRGQGLGARVRGGVSGMKTDSMTFPSSSLKVNLVVPSSSSRVRSKLGPAEAVPFGKQGAAFLAQVGHCVDIINALLPQPGEDLTGRVARPAKLGAERLELGEGQRPQIRSHNY